MSPNDRDTAIDPARPASAGRVAAMWATLVVCLTAASVAVAMLLWRAGAPLSAAAALLVAPGAHALALAVEFGWMRQVNATDPAGGVDWRTWIVAWLRECADALRVFGLWQPFLSRQFADHLPARSRGSRGVLLVHGFVCNRGLWRHWIRRLSGRQVPTLAVNLEPVFGRIDDYVPIIETAVRRLEAATGLPPVIVAHSMGGLAARRWWRQAGNAGRVHHLITIGTPHHGTRLARLAAAPNARQMRRDSAWLQDLGTDEAGRRARTTCFLSDADNIVFPAHSAALEGADNRLLRGVGHISLVTRPEPWAELQARLGGGDDPSARTAETPQDR